MPCRMKKMLEMSRKNQMMLTLRIQRRSVRPPESFLGVSRMQGIIVQSASRKKMARRTKMKERLTLLVVPSGEVA